MLKYDKNNWLPEHIRGNMRRYMELGIEPGSGLSSILQNDLVRSFSNADDIVSKKMHDIVMWLYNEAPSESWGSPENFKNWIEKIEKESEETIRYRNRKVDYNDNEPF